MCQCRRDHHVEQTQSEAQAARSRCEFLSMSVERCPCCFSSVLDLRGFTSPKMDANMGISALTHTARLTNSLARSLKRMVTIAGVYWRMHDNWVAYFRIWSRRSVHRSFGRALPYRSQSDVFNLPKTCCVTPTFETKNHRLE